MGGKHGKHGDPNTSYPYGSTDSYGNTAYDDSGKHGHKNKNNKHDKHDKNTKVDHTTHTTVTPAPYGYTETRTDVYHEYDKNANKHRVTESEQIHIANRDQMHPELVSMVPVGPMADLRVNQAQTRVVTTETTHIQPPPTITQTTHVQDTYHNSQAGYGTVVGEHGRVHTVTDPTYPVNPVVNPNYPVNPNVPLANNVTNPGYGDQYNNAANPGYGNQYNNTPGNNPTY